MLADTSMTGSKSRSWFLITVGTVSLGTVAFFDSTNHPDGDGVIIVVERHRGWDSGVLVCRQRNSEWQGVHLNGQVMRAGTDFGFSRLQKDGTF